MLKKICCALLSALLLQAAAANAFAKSDADREAERAAKVRTQLMKLGTGEDARVRVELRDKTKLEGYLSEVGADTFAVTDSAGRTTTAAYPQVRKARGNNLSTGAKIGIGIGIGVGMLIILYSIYAANER